MRTRHAESRMLRWWRALWHALLASWKTELKRLGPRRDEQPPVFTSSDRAAYDGTDILPYSRVDVVCLDHSGIVSGLSGSSPRADRQNRRSPDPAATPPTIPARPMFRGEISSTCRAAATWRHCREEFHGILRFAQLEPFSNRSVLNASEESLKQRASLNRVPLPLRSIHGK